MRAIICTKYGGPEVLQVQEVKKPVYGDHELLIRVQAGAVTTAGLISRTGKPIFTRLITGLSKPRKNILGMELAGEVVAIGKAVKLFKKGDSVFGITSMALGAHAEYVTLPEKAALVQQPNNINYTESTAAIEGGLTAIHFLKNKAKVKRGQQVLIYGASGSVGTASVQIAKYYGAEVTAVCSTANLNLVKSLGADSVIDYTQTDFTQNDKQYDIIFDTIGKRSFPQCKASLKPKGIYLDPTGMSTVFHMMWTSLFSSKKAILTTTYTRSANVIKEDLLLLKEWIVDNKFKGVVDRTYSMEQIVEAHQYVETGRKRGNVLIRF